MDDVLERPSAEFEIVAAHAATQELVTLKIDVDLLQWLTNTGQNVEQEINGLLRFYRDTTEAKVREFEPEAWEPGELQEAPPAP